VLLVGVLAGVTVGGGVGVFAASSTKTVTVCVDKKDNHMNYSKDSKCKSHQYKVVLNQKGVAGAKGAVGAVGAAGAKGDTGAAGAAGAKGDTGAAGAAGAKGDTGAAGAKGDTGAAGAKGDTGAKGADGTNGTNGTDGAAGMNGAAGLSSPTGFTARSVCGSNGTTLCAVGVQGPGGGVIVYVDSTNEMFGYDYLEVAPADASSGIAWSTLIEKCGSSAGNDCQSNFVASDAGTALSYIALGTGRAATALIVARHNAGGVAKNLYAAGIADAYTTATASDWFLPSKDELNEVCKYARNTGQAAGASTVCAGGTLRTGVGGFDINHYVSSSEKAQNESWRQYFNSGSQDVGAKSTPFNMRPVRAF
jgi:hypothetical protein